jgi:hypothetical protein
VRSKNQDKDDDEKCNGDQVIAGQLELDQTDHPKRSSKETRLESSESLKIEGVRFSCNVVDNEAGCK